MAETKKTPIVIDDVEYQLEDMSQDQQMLVNHIMDLERKISASRFNLDQMTVGKDGFIQMLKQSLEKKEEVVQ
jgi:hypothetical protein